LFGSTLFLAAFLLFSVQPMVGKLVLPALGGTPGVWNTCMVFYQTALLAGYALAHFTTTSLRDRWQLALQALLLGTAVLCLPISIPVEESSAGLGSSIPSLWLFRVLALASGPPLLALATTAPLLQRWFSLSRHGAVHDPYFLYAVSNAGSMLGLACYPLLIEPLLTLSEQGRAWGWGFVALAGLVLACGVVCRNRAAQREQIGLVQATHGPRPSRREVGRWILLVFIPSSWLLGVTTYMTTDLAAIPLLWTIPLALYLLTYIVAFARTSARCVRLAFAFLPLVVAPLVMVLCAGFVQLFWIPLHLLAFFTGALVCHGQLAALRPAADHLTSFYLALAIGGVLGGAFNALLAPLVFDRLVEYPMAVVLACLTVPGVATTPRHSVSDRLADLLLPAIISVMTALLVAQGADVLNSAPGMVGLTLVSGLGVYSCVSGLRRPVRFALTAGGVLVAASLAPSPGGRILLRARDFYGTLKVLHDPRTNVNRLMHGDTLHGQQCLDTSDRRVPSTYYARSGPLGQVFAVIEPKRLEAKAPRIAVVGLGAGTMACYAGQAQVWTFYELDPAVARIAEDPRFFSYLADAREGGAQIEIVLGDARIELRKAPDVAHQMIVLDAFSSDAIPVHLLSREAINLYTSKLSRSGILAFHLTNRYLNLDPIIARLASDAHLVCRIRHDVHLEQKERESGKQPSIWAVMAWREADLGDLATDRRWSLPRVSPGERVWSDDYSNLASYLVLGARRFPEERTAPDPGQPTQSDEP
jgi:hypothetical protein